MTECGRRLHRPQFDHARADVGGPVCRVCGVEITLARFLAEEECRGRMTCEPPSVHVFLDGLMRCECRALDYEMLKAVHSETPRP